MRILIPIIGFGRAGGYRVLSELASHWTDLGATVDFLVDARSDPPYFPTRAGIRRFGRDGREAAASATPTPFAARGNAVSIYLGMWRALRRLTPGYDVVLANHSLTAWPVALAPSPASGRRGRVYYIQAYEPEYLAVEHGWRARILERLSAASYHLPLRRIVNAPIYLSYRRIRAAHWIPPGMDDSLFTRRSTLPGAGPDEPWTVGVIGRREPSKGTADALAAFERLAARRPDVRLRVAYGNLPEGWSHPRADVVVPADDRELGAYYRSLDIMLAPGTQQLGAAHYPVLEAMASGVAVVTTGYLPAAPDNAWLVPVHAPDAIAAAIEDIMRTPPDVLAARLDRAAAAVEGFTWRAVAGRFLELLRQDA
jgi:glycosyltransferase involved in cell wall biosynthesis